MLYDDFMTRYQALILHAKLAFDDHHSIPASLKSISKTLKKKLYDVDTVDYVRLLLYVDCYDFLLTVYILGHDMLCRDPSTAARGQEPPPGRG